MRKRPLSQNESSLPPMSRLPFERFREIVAHNDLPLWHLRERGRDCDQGEKIKNELHFTYFGNARGKIPALPFVHPL